VFPELDVRITTDMCSPKGARCPTSGYQVHFAREIWDVRLRSESLAPEHCREVVLGEVGLEGFDGML